MINVKYMIYKRPEKHKSKLVERCLKIHKIKSFFFLFLFFTETPIIIIIILVQLTNDGTQ